MVKYREILRLHALGVSVRNIAFSCRCSTATVRAVTGRAKANGLSWPLPEEMGDRAIRDAIYPPKSKADPDKAPIDHEHIDAEMSRPGVTMMLLWSEYCEAATGQGKSPYMYSAFCDRHRSWAQAHKATMHMTHRPAEQMQVDYAGDTMEVVDIDTGELLKVHVFVACLPFSGKLYAKGAYDMKEESWVDAHVSAFSFFGGTTPIIVPDNLKQGVVKHTIDELVINEQYRRMAEYYGCAIVPGRPRRPRDKAAVEMGVRVIEQRAIAPLRNRVFTSLDELNDALMERVDEINARPFQKREGSRDEVFSRQEKALLVPLPHSPYEMVIRKGATVNFSYHVSFDGRWYSVPFAYVRREVEICATKSAVWIVCDGGRIAMHERSRGPKGSYSTNPDHMPDTHRDFTEWSGQRFRKWAKTIGVSCATAIDAILSSRKIEQQSYRSCRAVLALADKHGREALEQACAKALSYSPRPSYKTIKSILAGSVKVTREDPDAGAYLRGSDYYTNLEDEGDVR
ncbi:IS21 family transposase [Adlercreutzia sp. R25]|uniref:IS21 family transposase n=1 Tax=Adlercreutzia shanghongiae TaxID=3111773 RepID=A0ABU6IVT0_9ACTN|nr:MULTISPECIES: IS21 family transposase [unclassified Adlercreutzia]MEC4273888.1 IS21 family transposase [Adlercreutzia sp. R25]MEC4293833.1 IS21 family transposase [Adlercreutzia sp. R22]